MHQALPLETQFAPFEKQNHQRPGCEQHGEILHKPAVGKHIGKGSPFEGKERAEKCNRKQTSQEEREEAIDTREASTSKAKSLLDIGFCPAERNIGWQTHPQLPLNVGNGSLRLWC